MPTVENDDNGSLVTGSRRLAVGDRVRIAGEARVRTVTYVMGSERKGWRACFKGQGALPVGTVAWDLVGPGGSAAPAGQRPALAPEGARRPPEAPQPAAPSVPNGRAPLAFDAYLTVDWSAAQGPCRGPDSVWLCLVRWRGGRATVVGTENPATRARATARVNERLRELVAERASVLVGFDFPYGYPAGLAPALGFDGVGWLEVWRHLAGAVVDAQAQRTNNRFEVAAALNQHLTGQARPFWGCPANRESPTLGQVHVPSEPFRERRLTELGAGRAQPVWKLYTAGSVGSQTLLGLPRLLSLREDPALAPWSRVWPFETGCALPPREPGVARVVHAEIYPSLVPFEAAPGQVKDEAQVIAQALHLAQHDAAGTLDGLFAVPAALPAARRRDVEREEGWILGVTRLPPGPG